MARIMKRAGFENIWVLKGGWKGWKAAGYPVAPK
ncbi:MAG: rhodanese-like domain-containing protein [Desulfobacterales bacterium]